jgi:bifunctional DNase/RNase
LVEAKVSGVAMDDRYKSPVIILQEKDGERVLPIWIGGSEAHAIMAQLAGKKFQRPLTHDLLVNVIKDLKAKVLKVTITDLKDNTFYAEVLLQRQNELVTIDARPSDSIALAVRTNSPIYIAEKLLEGGQWENKPKQEKSEKEIEEEKARELKRFLENLRLEDFGKFNF